MTYNETPPPADPAGVVISPTDRLALVSLAVAALGEAVAVIEEQLAAVAEDLRKERRR
jgi:hypothetical protein